jgi:hypothetical protein
LFINEKQDRINFSTKAHVIQRSIPWFIILTSGGFCGSCKGGLGGGWLHAHTWFIPMININAIKINLFISYSFQKLITLSVSGAD